MLETELLEQQFPENLEETNNMFELQRATPPLNPTNNETKTDPNPSTSGKNLAKAKISSSVFKCHF